MLSKEDKIFIRSKTAVLDRQLVNLHYHIESYTPDMKMEEEDEPKVESLKIENEILSEAEET